MNKKKNVHKSAYSKFPHGVKIDFITGVMENCDRHYQRFLKDMNGMYQDLEETSRILNKKDVLLYEVYEKNIPELDGELQYCVSITYPGKIGQEYFMTKGHFHLRPDTAEIYLCMRGQGLMLMENQLGQSRVEQLCSNRVIYVPPFWAHRTINIGSEPLISFCVYPGDAGHAYGPIEKKGFRKIVIEQNGTPIIIDNPKY